MTERCAVGTAASGVPLAGTAPQARAWLVVEQRIAFAARALESERVDPRLRQSLPRTDASVLLARHGRRSDQAERFWYADVRTGRFVSGVVTDLLDALAGGRPPESAGSAASAQPVAFVCTNGSRDQCCAIESRPLLDQLRHRDDVWECSHLGGHRFAPTALILPTGYAYGRLSALSLCEALDAASQGEIATVGIRGRCDLPPTQQSADIAVRSRGQAAASRLVRASTLSGDSTQATIALDYDDGRGWRARLQVQVNQPLPESCGKTPVPSHSWMPVEVVEVN